MPIIILVIAGVLMGIMVLQKIPGMQARFDSNSVDARADLASVIMAENIKGFIYPVWVLVFWFFFTITLLIITSSLGGRADVRGFFNCTSFLIYPYAALQVIKMFLTFFSLKFPFLMYIHWVLLTVLLVWTVYILVLLVKEAGNVNTANAVLTAGVTFVLFSMIWILYSYNYVILMFLRR